MLGKWRIAWILVLALLAGPAFALGLGQIQVRSQYGEPLLAEIPIVSSDPEELRQLQARLASPETFARIGLEPPRGVVSDLQFTVALDANGRPVIRVTSATPVDQPLLTFLLEVDWGQGRLVREYSALVDAPDTVAAPAQPPIQAPDAAPSGTIVRPPEQAAATLDPDAQAAPAPVAEAPGDGDAAVEDAVAPPPRPAPAATAMSVPGEYGPVQAGDTLSQIVQRIARDDDVSMNQMMLALLRANPEAFIGGNVNLVRQGAVLRMPARDEMTRVSAAEATAEVRAQVARWREMSTPAPQPDAAVADAASAGDAADGSGADAGAARVADARLEIVPPSQGGRQEAGTRSGVSAGGEGEMLRQELQKTEETLAARDAEVEELKARLAELEALQQQQQQLITLKDSELASAQQRLAESNQGPAPGLSQTAEQQPAEAPPQAADSGGLTWLWLGVGIALLLAALAAWLLARRGKAPPVRRFKPGSLAERPPAAGPDATAGGQPTSPAPAQARGAPGGFSPTWHAGSAVGAGAGAGGAGAATAAVPVAVSEPEPMSEPKPEPKPEPVAEEPASLPQMDVPAEAAEDAGIEALPAMQERLELARAYVELGDVETARSLLQEVAGAGASVERGEAERLLRELE